MGRWFRLCRSETKVRKKESIYKVKEKLSDWIETSFNKTPAFPPAASCQRIRECFPGDQLIASGFYGLMITRDYERLMNEDRTMF